MSNFNRLVKMVLLVACNESARKRRNDPRVVLCLHFFNSSTSFVYRLVRLPAHPYGKYSFDRTKRPVEFCKALGLPSVTMAWIAGIEASVSSCTPTATKICMPFEIFTPDLSNGRMFQIANHMASLTSTIPVHIARGSK